LFARIDVGANVPGSISGLPLFRGGVLLPDGRILAPPAFSEQFLLIDPPARSATPVGPLMAVAEPGYSGAVLGCDGHVYVAPDRESELLRVDVVDGGLDIAQLAPLTGTGGIVVSACDTATHLVMPKAGGWFEATVDSDGGTQIVPHSFQPGPRLDLVPRGAARIGDVDVAFAPLPLATTPAAVISTVGNALLSTMGGLTDGGTLGITTVQSARVATFLPQPAYVIVGVTVDRSTSGVPFAIWPVTRGDGFVYAAAGGRLIAGSEEIVTDVYPSLSDWGDGGELGGLVNALDGTIVGIPGTTPFVRFFVPLDGGVAPPGLLLSPFLNKN
jgi:hypothetical protein